MSDFRSVQTREHVKAELARAQAEGLIVHGESAIERALFADFQSTLSRAQVRAGVLEARRLGLLDGSGEVGLRVPTPAQAESSRRAGLAIGPASLARND